MYKPHHIESIDPRSVRDDVSGHPALTTTHPALWLSVLIMLLLIVGAFQ